MNQVRRSEFLFTVGALLAAPFGATAQPDRKMYRVAFIITTSPIAAMAGPDPAHPITRAFVHEMRSLGYVEGTNLIIERRSAEGVPQRYPDIIADVLRLKPDVIVTSGSTPLNRLVKDAARDIPVVFFGISDPVKDGLAVSLARPGGNMTGITADTGAELEAKRFALLKEAFPAATRVAYLATRENLETELDKAALQAARSLGFELVHVNHIPTDLTSTFADVQRARPDVLVAALAPQTYGQRDQIVRYALDAKLPGIFPYGEMAVAGGLMSYGMDVSDLGRQAARYVDKILKGAKPADLPIEQPIKFEFLVNLKTAKALGLTIPKSVLMRADRVIE